MAKALQGGGKQEEINTSSTSGSKSSVTGAESELPLCFSPLSPSPGDKVESAMDTLVTIAVLPSTIHQDAILSHQQQGMPGGSTHFLG